MVGRPKGMVETRDVDFIIYSPQFSDSTWHYANCCPSARQIANAQRRFLQAAATVLPPLPDGAS